MNERPKKRDSSNENHDQLLSVLNNLDAAVYVSDMETYELHYVNDYVKETFGATKGRKCWRAFHDRQAGPCDFCMNSKLLASNDNPGKKVDAWKFMNIINGQRYEIRSRAIRWPDGRMVRLVVAIDITGALRAKRPVDPVKTAELMRGSVTFNETLEEDEERYRALFEESKDGFFITSPSSGYLEINQAGLDILGYTSAEELSQAWLADDIFTRENDRDLFYELIGKNGFVSNFEIGLRKKTGEPLIVHLSVSKEMGAAGELVLKGTMRDMTSLKNLHEQLIQSKKMESVGRLAGGVAHDFNNILMIIQGYTDLAMMELSDADPLMESLRAIREASEKAAALTRQLLLFGRKETFAPHTVKVTRVINGMLEMMSRFIGEQYQIGTDIPKDTWAMLADISHMEQVVMNLVINARDAMPDGGEIMIRTENTMFAGDHSSLNRVAGTGNFVCMSVEDQGIGMDAEVQQHLFEPFFTTKEAGKGTGLGLSVVYSIAAEHGGWVNVESSMGEGTLVKIFIPAVLEEAGCEDDEPALIDDLGGTGERILLIEDNESVRALGSKILSEYGYRVFAAENRKTALKIFERESGNFDLVFSDVILPDGNGFELVNQLKTQKPDLKVMLASGYFDADSMNEETVRIMDIPLIQKPYIINDLLRTTREILSK